MALTNQSITVVGTVRNCEQFIEKEYLRFKSVLSDFQNVNFFIVESDSDDNSVYQLQMLKAQDESFDFISLGNLITEFPKRTERIALCRNRYLEELEKNSNYQNTDFVLVSDMDGMNDLLTKDGVSSCWTFDGWDVNTANQKGKYYDLWALRHPAWSPNDCWEQFAFYTDTLKMPGPIAKRKSIDSRQIIIPEDCIPIEVESAFGGLGIYKKKVLKNVRYIGVGDEGNELCEHIALHAAIRKNGGKIFINPKLINCISPKEHISHSKGHSIKYNTALLFPKMYSFFKKKLK